MKKLFLTTILAISISGFHFKAAFAESASSIVKIKATVVAGCLLDAPETVTLNDIPSSEFKNKVTGDYLNNYSKSFDLIASCSGTDRYKYTFTVSKADGGCIGTNVNFMRYCLKFEENFLDLSSGVTTLDRVNVQGNKTTIVVVPQVGVVSESPVGEVNGQVTVTIEPI